MHIPTGDYWLLLAQADMETKIIFVIFGAMSIIGSIIIGVKLMGLRSKMRIARAMIKKIRDSRSIDDLLSIEREYGLTVPGGVLHEYLGVIKKAGASTASLFSDQDEQRMQDVIDQTIDDILFREESSLSFIATSAAVAPLIGLFGTVSGLIHSFIQIAQTKSADIAAIAPGIAEALITTWGGLIVAIAFLALYNFIQSKVRVFEHQLMQLGDRLVWFSRSL